MPNKSQQFDFHRTAFVLIPQDAPNEQFETVLIEADDKHPKERLFCSCATRKSYADCIHAKTLSGLHAEYVSASGFEKPSESFKNSIFWKLLDPVTRHSTSAANSVICRQKENLHETEICDFQNRPILLWKCEDDSGLRLAERMNGIRFQLMNRTLGFMLSDQEKQLMSLGHKTQRQTVEDSFWYRLAYHCFRENDGEVLIDFETDTQKGTFTLCFQMSQCSAHIVIPSRAVPDLLQALVKHSPENFADRIGSDEHELMFTIDHDGSGLCSVNPCICIKGENGDTVYRIDNMHVFGSLIYIKDISVFLRMSSSSIKLLATGWGEARKVKKTELPAFIDKNITSLSISSKENNSVNCVQDLFSVTDADDLRRILHPQIITSFDHMELCPMSIISGKCTLTVRFVKDSSFVNITDLLETKRNKQRFFVSESAIIDCRSKEIISFMSMTKNMNANGTITLKKASLLQFRGSQLAARFSGDAALVKQIREMLDFLPGGDLEEQSVYNGSLRHYQKIGVQWLLFLYDNGFGGLLCDDMGLGKTHQVLSFIASLKEHRKAQSPVLIVCPTSVMSHWVRIICEFAPSLKTTLYYDSDRASFLDNEYDILITSYAILRIDNPVLCRIHFSCAIFDEAQTLKNSSTSTFHSAALVNADVKFGLSGTPVENSLGDLKSLFAIAVPGLLTDYDEDSVDLLDNIGSSESDVQISNIRRLTNPFILRRLKETVLTELPPKIIDNRICGLSGDQFAMYQSILEMKGQPLVRELSDTERDIPYMHVFAVLNSLKKICCHPALENENPVMAYESLECGKWDLFRELLDESIGSGQKVAVFSQYLGMIDIMDDYLEKSSIGHVCLTGATKKRDKVIKQFAEDESCRVFLGSLKAGGVGIDLVSASVVIHYDRWWNAAREDQATDRVHRIGQKRGVQVFKLITEGTIEEKIDMIIRNKKAIAEAALTEDSADSLKQFDREELIELLSFRTNV